MHKIIDIIEIMSGIETSNDINFHSFAKRYQEGLKTEMKEAALYLNVLIY